MVVPVGGRPGGPEKGKQEVGFSGACVCLACELAETIRVV